MTVGCFDLLHEGHANLLIEMSRHGQVTVGLHDDLSIWANKGRMPVQTFVHRRSNLLLTGLADRVELVDDPDPSDWIAETSASGEWLYMRGDDWPDFPGRRTVEGRMLLKLIPYTEGVSSSDLRP